MGIVGEIINNPIALFGEKSVYVKRWNRPCATAFLISMQFRTLAELFKHGVFKYTPAEPKKSTFTEIVQWQPNK